MDVEQLIDGNRNKEVISDNNKFTEKFKFYSAEIDRTLGEKILKDSPLRTTEAALKKVIL